MKALTIMAAFLFLLSGCGTSVGNPEGPVVIQSDPYASAASAAAVTSLLSPLTLARFNANMSASISVSAFKFCVRSVKLKGIDGQLVRKDDKDEFEAPLGLVDVSNPAVATSWGQVTIPVGFLIGELDVEIHRDPQLCGVSYSVQFNNGAVGNTDLTKDMEFKFGFNPQVPVTAGSTFTLNLANIAGALTNAASASEFTDDMIDRFLDGTVKGSGK